MSAILFPILISYIIKVYFQAQSSPTLTVYFILVTITFEQLRGLNLVEEVSRKLPTKILTTRDNEGESTMLRSSSKWCTEVQIVENES